MNHEDHIGIVPQDLLMELAAEAPQPVSRPPETRLAESNGGYTSRLKVDQWLTDRGVPFDLKPGSDGKGRTVYVLKTCPFDPDHTHPDACIMQDVDGKLSAHCFHNSCRGRGWHEFKQAIGAPERHHYDPPLPDRRKRHTSRRFRGSKVNQQRGADSSPSGTDGVQSDEEEPVSHEGREEVATAEIPLPDGDPVKLQVGCAGRKPQRLVVALRGELEHRDRVNTDSSTSRERFITKLAAKLAIARDVLEPLVEPQLTKLAGKVDEKGTSDEGGVGDDSESQATLAATMAAEWHLWHTPANDGYATIPVDRHLENWPVRSQTFKRFLAKKFFEAQGTAMNSEALAAAINLFEAQALFDGEEHPVCVRVGEHNGNIYLDLCNATWEVVEITPQNWCVVDKSPVRFRRAKGMLPLPTPQRGGKIELLRDFLNVDDTNWCLVSAFLVAALRPRGPYPILALFAEQGSGKSMAGRLLREVVDPNSAPLRAEPRDGRDLMIAATNSWCVAYDNLSYVPSWLSDAMCRLSTGGGFSTRELYTDSDEVIFDSQRPILLTSIEEVATRSDLLDRSLIVWLPTIPEESRRAEAEMLAAFEKVRPLILGALLDAVAIGLQRLPSMKLTKLPRMADFALWVAAAEPAFGWPEGTFMAAYQANRDSANDVALEASVVAQPLLDLLESQGRWSGSSGELLKLLEERLGDQVHRLKGWPKNPRSLSGELKRLAPNLRKAGWVIDQDRTAKKRTWTILRHCDANVTQPSSVPSFDSGCDAMQPDADECSFGGDDARDANDDLAGLWNPDRY